jgi:DNA-binding CsgD family transcriptional regulator
MDDAVRRAFTTLTPRQRECLELAAQHWTSKDIARHLGISPKTADRHLEEVIRKLGVADRLAAIRLLRTLEAAPPQTQTQAQAERALAPAHGDDPHTAYAPGTPAAPTPHERDRGGEKTHGQALTDVHLARRTGGPGDDRRDTASKEGGVLAAGTFEGGFGGDVSERAVGGDHKHGATPPWSALGAYERTPEPLRRLGWILVIAASLALAAGALIGSYDLMFSFHRMGVEQAQHYSSLDLGRDAPRRTTGGTAS